MIRRREFITLIGGAAATWPLAASAQQPAMPVSGYCAARHSPISAHLVRAFRQGLKELGCIEGQNVRSTYRWADNPTELAEHCGRIGRRPVAVIVCQPQQRRLAAGDPRPCRSCSRPLSTRSGLASSRAWPGRAATSPASSFSDRRWPRNGWNCSRVDAPRVTRVAVLGIRPSHPGSGSSPPSRRWRRPWGCS